MQRNNTYDIAKCWAIVSVIVYHVINIIFYNRKPPIKYPLSLYL